LDPEENDLLYDRWLELRAVTIEREPSPWKSKSLVEKQETCILEAQEMASVAERIAEEAPCTIVEEDPTVLESARTLQEPFVEYGVNLGFLMLSTGGIRMSHYLQK
jgi:hypothetical protein